MHGIPYFFWKVGKWLRHQYHRNRLGVYTKVIPQSLGQIALPANSDGGWLQF
jgi:hypothetical protein